MPMFIQVITAKVVDEEGLTRQVDRWEQEIRPGATGFLGSTSGVTDDGRLIVLARFDSEESAQRNNDRPEQGSWWADTEKMLDEVTFQNSTEVIEMGGGGSDDAGFVQVMRGRILDAAKMEELRSRMAEFEAIMASHRPDVLGDVTIIHAGGAYTDAVYFTSEAEARANENKEMPAEMQAMFEEWMTASTVDEYIDLKRPRLV
ncbi:MAG TPA: hypothetical protein VMZ51_05125 [Acidimicrobiales bacterium]|nr:hypothetical protein [Acidimicrobiales bacterium]